MGEVPKNIEEKNLGGGYGGLEKEEKRRRIEEERRAGSRVPMY
jgi:hypothetical protein